MDIKWKRMSILASSFEWRLLNVLPTKWYNFELLLSKSKNRPMKKRTIPSQITNRLEVKSGSKRRDELNEPMLLKCIRKKIREESTLNKILYQISSEGTYWNWIEINSLSSWSFKWLYVIRYTLYVVCHGTLICIIIIRNS